MNKEQLDEIKSRVSIIGKYKEFDKAVSAMILTKDVPATIAEVERLQQFEQKAIYTIEENKRLREALEFYADEENYEWHEINDLETMPGDVLNDNGKKARQALGGDKCS